MVKFRLAILLTTLASSGSLGAGVANASLNWGAPRVVSAVAQVHAGGGCPGPCAQRPLG
jgi:hypothetical protein